MAIPIDTSNEGQYPALSTDHKVGEQLALNKLNTSLQPCEPFVNRATCGRAMEYDTA